ncbi:MAG: TolC family protein [Flavitalea sp.]
MTIRKIVSLLAATFLLSGVSAQEKWDLKRAVEFAVANNISVKQADVQARIAALNLKQSRLQQIPTVNITGSACVYGGRSIDPTTNQFTNQQILSTQFGLNSGVTLFNFFSIKNNIEGNRLENEAALINIEKIRNDISLNVATAYLQILVAIEQENIAKVAVQQTLVNLDNTRKRVEAGGLPELNLAELEAQLARDSTTLITQEATVRTNKLRLKAILNLDAAEPFDVTTPPLDQIPVESLGELLPEGVFQQAVVNLPQQKVLNKRIEAARKFVQSARGQMYPAFGAFAGLGSQYSNNQRVSFGDPIFSNTFSPTGAKVTVDNVDYQVLQPNFTVPQTIFREKFGPQISDNFRQNVGLQMNIPLFNSGQSRTAWERSKLNVNTLELQKDQDLITLKQDIYIAYNDAIAASQRFSAGQKSVSTAEKAYNFATKRYELGLLSTVDLLTNQNNLNRAKVELSQAHVDYIFRLKLLEFYKGSGIKLQ